MSDSTITAANQSGFQQLSSLMAKRSAQQAEELAKTLRRQADAVQAVADQYEAKAQSLDNRADKAKANSDTLHARLSLTDAFNQGATRLSNTMAQAAVKADTYTAQGLSMVSAGKLSASGANLDTTA